MDKISLTSLKRLIQIVVRRRFVQVLFLWGFAAFGLYLLDPVIPGFKLQSLEVSFILIVVISLLYNLFWPPMLTLLAKLPLILFALLTLVLNGCLMYLVSLALQGVEVTDPVTALLVVMIITIITTLCARLFSLDENPYYFYSLQRRLRRPADSQPPVVTSVVFLEIDGCSEPILRKALEQDYMPTLARWLKSGSHKLQAWECEMGTQTCSSQAGILHGTNRDIPAYRWYEKATGQIISASHTTDMAQLESRLSNGQGLLANGGICRGTIFSGDASQSLFTSSTLFKPGHNQSQDYYAFFADPYNFIRTVLLFGWEVVVEICSGWVQRLKKVQPRSPRGGLYPLVRAFTTVVLRELSIYTLMADLLQGRLVSYTSFLGYDEVAHHSGMAAPDALAILGNLDKQLARLERVARRVPHQVKFVVLSDHGHSQGATFKQRTGRSLPELVDNLLGAGREVLPQIQATEGWRYLNVFLKGAADHDTRPARLLRRVTKSRTIEGGEVDYGPERQSPRTVSPEQPKTEAIVLASGNLGLIYFTSLPQRLSLEQINTLYPGLIAGLILQPYIGFVMVRSEKYGPLVMGAGGVYFLAVDRYEGCNPLQNFDPQAPAYLRREDAFSNVPDILVNSFYDPNTEEVAAFEELVSCHGGLGGQQGQPFLLYPAELAVPAEKIYGAEKLYALFKGWLAQLHQPVEPEISSETEPVHQTG
jgi:uncharacterized membrane protein YvlD (DUF360 family)